jgi:hypothetical protein
MKTWMLGAAMVAGAAAMGSMPAAAQEFGMHMRGPVAYVPPCPGPGYFWVDGYMTNGYWVPGRWEFRGGRGYDRVYYGGLGHEQRYDRDRHGWGREERGGYDGRRDNYERGRR